MKNLFSFKTCNTLHNVNNIDFDIHDRDVSLEVETTIMQIKHQKMIFNAKGFFIVNNETMLQVNVRDNFNDSHFD